VAVVLAIVTTLGVLEDARFASEGIVAEAMIVSKRVERGAANDSSSEPRYQIEYRFRPGSVRDPITSRVYIPLAQFNDLEVGDEIDIEFLESEPGQSRPVGGSHGPGSTFLFGLIAIVCAGVGFVMLRSGLYSGRLAAQLKANGQRARARIIRFSASRFRTDNEVLFCAEYEFTVPTGETISGKTHPRVMAEYGPVRAGDEIHILVENQQPYRSIWAHDANSNADHQGN
jgi:hypothetical protein